MFNISRLKFLCTTEQYLNAVHRPERWNPSEHNYYLKFIPQYIIARCPICGEKFMEQVDIHSLAAWSNDQFSGDSVLEGNTVNHCSHFYQVYRFINLNGHIPSISYNELGHSISMGCEVPHVVPFLLRDDTGCQAVMHSLPICRIENSRFVPTYSLYTITYYAPETDVPVLNEKLKRYIRGMRWESFWGRLVWPARESEEEARIWWDLPLWAEKKRLLWLEPDNTELPLRSIGDSVFPYSNITGRKSPYGVQIPNSLVRAENKKKSGSMFETLRHISSKLRR